VAFAELARRRLLGQGADHTETEQRVAEARSTGGLAALALDVPQQAVIEALNGRVGTWAGDVYQACVQGGHDPVKFHARLRGQGNDPIEYVTKLARRLRELS
jgi:hypothetical protein